MNQNRLWVVGIFVVVVAGCLVYSNSLKNKFCYDDLATIQTNVFIRSFKHFAGLFRQDYFIFSAENSYRPVVTLTYLLDYAVYQERPWGYHLTNVILHAACAGLVAFVLGTIISRELGLVTGLLFAVFPVNTEAVNAVSFREDILVVFFGLLSFLSYRQWRKRRTSFWLAGSCLLVFLACLSKENGVVIPFIILGSELILPGKNTFPGWKKPVLVYSIALAGYGLLRFVLFPGSGKETVGWLAGSWLMSLLNVPLVYLTYFKKLLFPYPLMADYPSDWATTFSWSLAGQSLAGIALIVFLLIITWRKNRVIFYGLFWLLLSLLPTSNIVPIFNPFAERYLYLPGIGFLLVVATGLARVKKTVGWALGLFLVTGYATLTYQRNPDWKDDLSLWSRTISQMKQPTARAHIGLGYGLVEKGELKAGEEQFRKAVNLRPAMAQAHLSLADVLADQERWPEAVKHYLLAIRLEPRQAVAHHNLAFVLEKAGYLKEAWQYYQTAIKLNPFYAQAYFNLGNLMAKIGQEKEAEEAYRRAVESYPGYAEVYYNWGNLLLQQGKLPEAEKLY
ncbi:MAG: tetratricopeptide repeat protein, partial [Candidatus Omnitrophica bacterium]|nr:tetratricopeptide repeat protein [Candidatus Omnitrophota bacterium]